MHAKSAKNMSNWTLKIKDCQQMNVCKQECALFLCLPKKFELTINFKSTCL
jgi:hypothetical protein